MNRFLAALLVLTCASSAEANGRFPRAQRLVQSAGDPAVLSLYGTYGLLVSRDAGRSWRHVCEAATGPYTGEDPLLEIMPGERILARTETALVTSTDSWCNWATALDGAVDPVQDITRDPADPLAVLALVGGFDAQTGFVSRFRQSLDGASTWSPAVDLPRTEISRGLSLDVTPSAPNRVLATGLDDTSQGRLVVSLDRGATWRGLPLTGTDSNSAPYLAQISKDDPDLLFVRTDTYREIDFIDTANDALLVSIDGGTSWFTAIERKAKLLGFALSPDEATLLVGYGDPFFAATYVEPADLGIYRARLADILANPAAADSAFVKIFEASVTCLKWTPSGLYACTSQSERGFELGRAADAEFTLAEPEPFESLLRLPEVRPLPCHAGTNGHACYTDPDNGFGTVCGTFQAPCDASPPPLPPPADGGAGASGAASDSGASSGGGGAGGTIGGPRPPAGASGEPASPVGGNAGSGAVDGGSSGGAAAERDSSSCACRGAGRREREGGTKGFAGALLFVIGVLRSSRRR